MMKNKQGMSISIVILVVTFLVLSSACLIALKLRKNSLEYEIISLEKVYVTEEVLNYNINHMMEESSGGTPEEFISSFRQELAKYKSSGQYNPYQLSQVEGQLTPANIRIEGSKAFLTLTFRIEGDVNDKVHASYTYTKIFEREIVQENI